MAAPDSNRSDPLARPRRGSQPGAGRGNDRSSAAPLRPISLAYEAIWVGDRVRGGISEKLRAFAFDWSAIGRPTRSLPSRIILSVFAAALVTSLIVTWMSTRTIEAFLRAKIDQKFPTILRATGERLDLWYDQRALDLATFAGSAIVAGSLGRMEAGGRGPAEARRELAQYLEYVLESFPQYESLFVLDAGGQILLRVGDDFGLPKGLRQGLARVADSNASAENYTASGSNGGCGFCHR